MSETEEFIIGAEVACEDGICGDLRRVVIDPIKRAVTHLVVEPRHPRNDGRLVPVDLVDTAASDLRLRCTLADFDLLEEAEETRFVTGAPGQWAYGQDSMFFHPYFGLGLGGIGGVGGLGIAGMGGMGGIGGVGGLGMGAVPEAITYEKVPLGEVDVRRGEHVHATDGSIGRVRGLVIDPSDHHVTHVLLDEGHLWGQKQVAIPIGAVTSVEDGVRLRLTKDEIRDLPPVDIDH